MNTWIRLLLWGFTLACGLWLTYTAINAWYLKPRSALLTTIEQAQATLARHRQSADRHRETNRLTRELVNQTLGPTLETVDHRLRSRLNQLTEQCRLQGVSVATSGSGKPVGTPAGSVFRAAAYRALRAELDFVEVEATITGVGALEDVVRLITAIEAEPWIKRIDQVRLDPRDNGARVSLTLRLTTLFVPGLEPAADQPAQPPSADLQSRFAALVSGNPFRVPPPPTPAPPTPPTPPAAEPAAAPPPPAFPFAEWALTGVAIGPEGPEAWLRHQPSGQTRVLMPGEALDAAVFTATSATADAAEFALGDQRFVVVVGATMDQRSTPDSGSP